ncbi:MAG TPA: DUF2079 domain-containing protein, partial [Armatimonadetes bacterium]|nr:DUF2079 domain-containing protein [Armatimonadota bacterium]
MRKWEATKVMKRALHALALYRYHIMTHLAIGIVMLWLLWTCILRYRVFGTSVDMAIYTQFCWLLSRGEVMTEATFYRSYNGPQHPSNPLAVHMALVLLPISVVYKLFPSPVTLITIQVLAVWFSVLGLWRLSQVRLRDSLIASLLSIGFALYPPMYFQARNDFHTDVFTMLAIIWLWVGIVEDKRWLFWSCLIGALSARESAAVPLLVLGMMLLLRRDERRFGAIILMASGIWFVLCNGLLLPWLRAGRPHVAMPRAYGYLGESLGKILISAVMNPSQVARYLISTDTWLTAIQLLAPMLFLPLLCPRFAIPAFTVFAMVFASRYA